jgi:NAD(P)H-hydrate epimerase
MRPLCTPAEMRAIDEAAFADVGLEVLVARAGHAVAHTALGLLGGGYGRRVVVVVGRGHNGDDGRVAATLLERRGARCVVLPAAEAPRRLPDCDLVIDAAYGTGFRGSYAAPTPPVGAPVLAVDIPSGLDGETGEAGDGAVVADVTVSFVAAKVGLFVGAGPSLAGSVRVADIGLDAGHPRAHQVEDGDIAAWLPPRARDAHKWNNAVTVVAGSPGMLGSAELCSRAALRSGSGMVRLGSPGLAPGTIPVAEVVALALPGQDWAGAVLEQAARCKALVLGPGLGTSEAARAGVRRVLAEADLPVVLDADGLNCLGELRDPGEDAGGSGALLVGRTAPTVLTPHEGELARLTGHPLGADRLAAARDLAGRFGVTLLLKGSTTVVAAPSGDVLLATAGSSRLATAGTGDVLSGVIGAFLARGVSPSRAAALGAHVHGRAAGRGPAEGLVAGDLPGLVSAVLGSGGAASARRYGAESLADLPDELRG